MLAQLDEEAVIARAGTKRKLDVARGLIENVRGVVTEKKRRANRSGDGEASLRVGFRRSWSREVKIGIQGSVSMI